MSFVLLCISPLCEGRCDNNSPTMCLTTWHGIEWVGRDLTSGMLRVVKTRIYSDVCAISKTHLHCWCLCATEHAQNYVFHYIVNEHFAPSKVCRLDATRRQCQTCVPFTLVRQLRGQSPCTNIPTVIIFQTISDIILIMSTIFWVAGRFTITGKFHTAICTLREQNEASNVHSLWTK